jgi:hypothetical protein
LGDRFPRLELLSVDGGFDGQAFTDHIQEAYALTLEAVK